MLDLLVACCTLSFLLWWLRSVIDLGRLTPDHAEKVVLILLVSIPARLAIGGRSWPVDRVGAAVAPAWARVRALTSVRVPAAVRDVAFAVAVTCVTTLCIAFIANLLFPPWRPRAFVMPFRYERFAEIFAVWDAGWYFDIARHGYYWRPDGQSSIAFFPLYPMVMRAVAWPFGGTDRALWVSGVLVSLSAYCAALVVLHRFTERVCGDRDCARRTVLYLAIFPFSVFFTRVYAESLFLLTSVLAVSRAYDRRWGSAGVWGALATLARPNGVLIGIPLALLAARDWRGWRAAVPRVAGLALIPLALASYCGFVYTLSGNPLGWLSAQSQWGYSLFHPPWLLLQTMVGRLLKHGPYDYFFVSRMATFRLLHGVTALAFLVLTPAIFRRFGAPLGMYVLVSLLVPLSGNALEGIGRYASVLFPVFMLAGSVKSPRAHEAILVTGALFLGLFVALFATWRPIY